MSRELEMELLGSLILDPSEIMNVGALHPNDFEERDLGELFEIILNGKINEYKLDFPQRTSQLISCVFDPSGVGGIARRLIEESLKRRLSIKGNISDGIAKQQKELSEAASRLTIEEHSDLFKVVKETVVDWYKRPNRGISTGYPRIDTYSHLIGGDMVIIAARPSVGKSALMMGMACKIAETDPVGVFSIEMPKESLAIRTIGQYARVDMSTHELNKYEHAKMVNALTDMKDMRMLVDDNSLNTVIDICNKTRRMVAKNGVKVIFIDYLQIIRSIPSKGQTREREVAHMSATLKSLAKELMIPVVVLSQLNRSVEGRGKDAEPKLSDLRDSGSIEQDADVVILISRNGKDAKIHVAKNRNGKTGVVEMHYTPEYTSFEEVVKYA